MDKTEHTRDWLKELKEKLDSMSNEEFQDVFKKYEEKCNLKSAHTSEDFDNEFKNVWEEYSKDVPVRFSNDKDRLENVARHFTEWQKQQMQSDNY